MDVVEPHADLGAKTRVIALHVRQDAFDRTEPGPLLALFDAHLLEVRTYGALTPVVMSGY
jgi:hypothetical protein